MRSNKTEEFMKPNDIFTNMKQFNYAYI